jgi:hypothetical protein
MILFTTAAPGKTQPCLVTEKRKLEDKGEVVPVHARKTYGGAEVQPYSLLSRHETKVEQRVKRPARQGDHLSYIASRLRMRGGILPLPHVPSLGAKGQLYL